MFFQSLVSHGFLLGKFFLKVFCRVTKNQVGNIMHNIVNAINNAFRYHKTCFKVKKNTKTIKFLKCLVKSNVIRYFKLISSRETHRMFYLGYVNPKNTFDVRLISKGGRRIYLGNPAVRTDAHYFFVLSDSLSKSYTNSYERSSKMSGEIVVKVFH